MATKESQAGGAAGCFIIIIIVLVAVALNQLNTCNESKKQRDKEAILIQDSINMVNGGFNARILENGLIPQCTIRHSQQQLNTKNTLKVTCSGDRNAVVKLINAETNNCVVYLYVNKHSDVTVDNIPAGKYNCKVAMGETWMMKTDSVCQGQFFRNAEYFIPKDTIKYYEYFITGEEIKLDERGRRGMNSPLQKSFENSTGTKGDFN